MSETMEIGRHGSEPCARAARRQGQMHRPGYAKLDRVGSRRSTGMLALSRAIGIIHGYQRDSSSKQPADSICPWGGAPRPHRPTRSNVSSRTRLRVGPGQKLEVLRSPPVPAAGSPGAEAIAFVALGPAGGKPSDGTQQPGRRAPLRWAADLGTVSLPARRIGLCWRAPRAPRSVPRRREAPGILPGLPFALAADRLDATPALSWASPRRLSPSPSNLSQPNRMGRGEITMQYP